MRDGYATRKEFRHASRAFLAKADHQEWLEKFQSREGEELQPGDAVRVLPLARITYDEFGQVLSTHYVVEEVREVISAQILHQRWLLEDNDEMS